MTDLILTTDAVTAKDPAAMFDVTIMTVHRDLVILVSHGLIRKFRSGVTAQSSSLFDSNVRYPQAASAVEKRQIARHAAKLTEPGQAIMLDDSTMTHALFPHNVGIAPLTDFDLIIADSGTSPLHIEELRESGVPVEVVEGVPASARQLRRNGDCSGPRPQRRRHGSWYCSAQNVLNDVGQGALQTAYVRLLLAYLDLCAGGAESTGRNSVAFFSRVSRGRAFRAVVAGMVVVSVAGSAIPASALIGNDGSSTPDALASVVNPPLVGQTDMSVYVSSAGHTLSSMFLDYWRSAGATDVVGAPISEPFASTDGLYSQAFSSMVLQYREEFLYTASPYLRPADVSAEVIRTRNTSVRRDGRRTAGGGDRRVNAWNPLPPDSSSVVRAYNEGGTYDEVSQHTILDSFANFYNRNEGWYFLGSPISQQLRERGVTVQYFTGGALMKSKAGVVSMMPIVAENAALLGIDTTPVDQSGLPIYDESLFITAYNPNPVGNMSAKGKKWIEISIDEQTLRAYQGDTVILESLVSTGLSPNDTEIGNFRVRLKVPMQDMAGFTNDTGEVVGLGDGSGTQEGERYEVKDVPNVMYINLDAEALHGAYWHNNFGNKMSHGCINLPLDVATFLYQWAPLGTEVWVH